MTDMAKNSKTRADAIYERIRADILSGRLRPGQRLPFAALTEDYGASTGVLREALPRLVEQGLVVSEPQVGFHVVPVSVDDLRHLTEARVAIETLVLRQSIEHGDIAWESRVLAAHHLLTRTPIEGADGTPVSEEWQLVHAAYHAALLEACPNPRLQAIANSLRDAGELYRCWTRGLRRDQDFEDDRDVAAEHRRILEAALARDVELASAELTQHIELTTCLLIEMSGAQQQLPPDTSTTAVSVDG